LLSNNCNFNSISTISKFYYCVEQFNKTKGLSIIDINCESIVKKIEEIRIFCCVYRTHFLCISESWFQNNTMTTNFVLMVMIFKGVIEAKEEVAEL
jgi:hypothetical protein